jgi:hypothetical protein
VTSATRPQHTEHLDPSFLVGANDITTRTAHDSLCPPAQGCSRSSGERKAALSTEVRTQSVRSACARASLSVGCDDDIAGRNERVAESSNESTVLYDAFVHGAQLSSGCD